MIQGIKTNIKLFSPYSCADLISKNSDTLTVLISGFGYSLDMPIFYYIQNLLENRNTDLLKIDFAYNKDECFLKLNDKEQDYQFKKELTSIQNYIEKTNDYLHRVAFL
jgi:predicted nucleotide-binding protein (sugar kinase/HSP70/actin superfamily)